MKNLKVKTKLSIIILMVALLVIGGSVVSVQNMLKIKNTSIKLRK